MINHYKIHVKELEAKLKELQPNEEENQPIVKTEISTVQQLENLKQIDDIKMKAI